MLRIVVQWIKDSLGFSKSEANGTLVLILIIILVLVLPKLYLKYNSEDYVFTADQSKLDQWESEMRAAIKVKEEKVMEEHENRRIKKVAAKSFPFDPNTVSKEDFISLGFTPHTASNLLSYRASGGSFKIKKDLKRIYGISSARVDALWDHITLPEVIRLTDDDRIDTPTELILAIELNSAKEDDLQQIRGIGPVLSSRIIGFRDKLGGFHHPNQLYEVYGLDSAVVESLLKRATVSGTVKKINLNTDSLKYLYEHPYIDYNLARAIFNYRVQRGKLDSIGEIKSIKILDKGLYKKIYPYLSIHP